MTQPPQRPTSVTLTYAFPWQGQTLEICQPPRQGILPPQEGERREMRWDPISRRLRELPSGRSSAMPILTYVFALSALTVAAGFAAALLPSVPPHGMFSPLPGGYRLSGRRILDDPAADPSLQKTGGVRHPSAGVTCFLKIVAVGGGYWEKVRVLCVADKGGGTHARHTGKSVLWKHHPQ